MHSFFTLKNKLPVIISSWLVLIVLWTLLIKFIFELIIIIYKLGVFFISPQWNIWDTNWMINKIIVLFLFIFITVILFTNKYYILYDLTEKESGS